MTNQVAELELLWRTEDQRIHRYTVILISFPIVTNQIGVFSKPDHSQVCITTLINTELFDNVIPANADASTEVRTV
jgi:hypothetical protein